MKTYKLLISITLLTIHAAIAAPPDLDAIKRDIPTNTLGVLLALNRCTNMEKIITINNLSLAQRRFLLFKATQAIHNNMPNDLIEAIKTIVPIILRTHRLSSDMCATLAYNIITPPTIHAGLHDSGAYVSPTKKELQAALLVALSQEQPQFDFNCEVTNTTLIDTTLIDTTLIDYAEPHAQKILHNLGASQESVWDLLAMCLCLKPRRPYARYTLLKEETLLGDVFGSMPQTPRTPSLRRIHQTPKE